MSVKVPKFATSPYFYIDDSGWHLTEDAPEDIRKEYEEYVAEYQRKAERGIFI